MDLLYTNDFCQIVMSEKILMFLNFNFSYLQKDLLWSEMVFQ